MPSLQEIIAVSDVTASQSVLVTDFIHHAVIITALRAMKSFYEFMHSLYIAEIHKHRVIILPLIISV